ncbi:DNA ligase d [Bacillus sp. OxB-1]|uniref:DNA ligase D n=1 Tax=Bacillus sp. (strain OxB-1) TaxID=98228 RepID=UPI0005820492|nr:DNA ligase D [Bacillus sp. OxB-1]BAQ11771.1 DNA ligase d [Bacillus sp. OxB-1]
MKPMLLTTSETIPAGKGWTYEAKYDGFRCILVWEPNGIMLFSRTGKVLNEKFPEVVDYCKQIQERLVAHLPLTLDGELVHLINPFKSEFSTVQARGRMRNEQVIQQHRKDFPCHYMVFDLVKYKGEDLTGLPLQKRKTKLRKLFGKIPSSESSQLQAVESFKDPKEVWERIIENLGEGIVAKRKSSTWSNEKRSPHWVKVKNWRLVNVIITQYDKMNGYFTGAVHRDGELVNVVTFLHGLSEEETDTLRKLFHENGHRTSETVWELAPSVCATIACISFDGRHLREPRFHSFDFEIEPGQIQWKLMLRQLSPLPPSFQMTHPDKPVWPELGLVKDDYLLYLQQAASFMLPFLKNRLLTVIRYPHGVPGERFYQKNAPDYTPEFIQTEWEEDIRYIVCQDGKSLLWLGNQLALEYHIPFRTIDTECPTEIVFDLDPPSVQEFSLAVEAALRMKAIFDRFQLTSFVKTSGGKGLQLYVPLPYNRFSYEETRVFTKFVCDFLCEQEPAWFTTERMKKKRGNKLYLDYVQHQEGKTIVAPYSPRGNEQGLVATPLRWEEVTSSLRPEQFPIPVVLERMKTIGNPFRNFRPVGEAQPFDAVLNELTSLLGRP